METFGPAAYSNHESIAVNKPFNKILLIDDDEDVLLGARLLLKQHTARLDTEKDPRMIPSLLKNETYDLILLDMNFRSGDNSGNEGLYWLSEIQKADTLVSVIMITAYGDIDLAVRAIKDGATDFIAKPWDAEKLIITVKNALKLRNSKLAFTRVKILGLKESGLI